LRKLPVYQAQATLVAEQDLRSKPVKGRVDLAAYGTFAVCTLPTYLEQVHDIRTGVFHGIFIGTLVVGIAGHYFD
jgi:hypothetical protein